MMMKGDSVYKNVLIIVTGLLTLNLIFNWVYLLYAALLISLLSLIIPKLAVLIVKLWFKLAEVLGWINSRILLSLVFYFFLLPIAIIYRLFNKDTLQLRKSKIESIYCTRRHLYTKDDIVNMW